jgi:hypothetical protein
VQGKYQRPLIGPGGTRGERAFPGGDHDVATLHGIAHFPDILGRNSVSGPGGPGTYHHEHPGSSGRRGSPRLEADEFD